jgi:hypothetical protein
MPEMMVAVSIMVVVTAVVAGLFVQVRKMIGITQWGVETRAQLRATVDALSQDLQNLDDSGYLLMLNRDYEATVYAGGPNGPVAADRISFVSQGPFNTMTNVQPGTNPSIAASARVYYGHSLWTHEWADAWWAQNMSAPTLPVSGPLLPLWGKFPTGFDKRPAVDWSLVRRAVLHMDDPSADPTVAYDTANPILRSNLERLRYDSEFCILLRSLSLYSWSDLSQWINGQVVKAPLYSDWLALLWAPSVYAGDSPLRWDDAVAPGRVLMPHAARVRFQVRLSDGTLVPQIDETDANLLQRGRLAAASTNDVSVTGLDPAYDLVNATLDPTALTGPTGAGPTITIDRQYGYVWTSTRTNVQSSQVPLWPVAVRVRIDVYDPQRRTPDPIRVDEWLPVRWNSYPLPAN